MTLTILAIIFLLFLIFIAVFGQRLLSQKTESAKETNREQCSLCRNSFDKDDLVERQIGDFKMMYFCQDCIVRLYNDLPNLQKKSLPSNSPAINKRIS